IVGDVDAQTVRNAYAARCPQSARFLSVRAVRGVPAGPGTAYARPRVAGGPAVGRGLVVPVAGCGANAAVERPAHRGDSDVDRGAGGDGRILVVPAPGDA